MELITANWEYALIGILCIDKIVALCPTKWDDLIWTSIKKSIYKIVGKDEADISLGLLYYKSPIGGALIGKNKNDHIIVNTPSGEKTFQINSVKYI